MIRTHIIWNWVGVLGVLAFIWWGFACEPRHCVEHMRLWLPSLWTFAILHFALGLQFVVD